MLMFIKVLLTGRSMEVPGTLARRLKSRRLLLRVVMA
jgi:hypothetical protein